MATSLCHSLVRHTIIKPIRFEKISNCIKLFESKNRITNAEATVVQMMHIAVTRNRAVIDFGGLFLLLFWTSKKVNNKK